MKVEWLDAHTRLLSVPPVFDEATAADIGQTYADRLSEGASRATPEALAELRLAGLLASAGDLWRIAEPLRSELRQDLFVERRDLFQDVATRFIDHAQNGLGESLIRVMGAQGSRVSIAVLRLLAKPREQSAFDELIEVVETGARLGRDIDTIVAARLIATVPEPDVDSRQINFLHGLSSWREGNRRRAVRLFEYVLLSNVGDRADAIAAHLVGADMRAGGNIEAAIPLLQRSVSLARTQPDRRGLGLSLLTLGMALRDRAKQAGTELIEIGPALVEDTAIADLQAAVDALEEAKFIGEQTQDAGLQGSALAELASTYAASGLTDLALETCVQAVGLLKWGRNAVYSRTVLGSLYKDAGLTEEAGRVLEEGASIARRDNVVAFELARLLNVLASNERRNDRKAAVRHARQSVELGRALNQRRHLAQALHTLGATLIDAAESPGSLVEAQDALAESSRILTELNDKVGLRMVSTTQDRLKKVRETLES